MGDYEKSVTLLNKAIQAEINLNKSNNIVENMVNGLSFGVTSDESATAGGTTLNMVATTRGGGNDNNHGHKDGPFGLLELVDHRFLVNRGDCLRAQHKYGLALIDYDAAMANLKIRKLGASSGVEGARRQWNVATRLSLTHYLVACDYFNENAYEDAERQLSLAVDYNPKVSEYYHARGRARYYIGQHQQAYEDFKGASPLFSVYGPLYISSFAAVFIPPDYHYLTPSSSFLSSFQSPTHWTRTIPRYYNDLSNLRPTTQGWL